MDNQFVDQGRMARRVQADLFQRPDRANKGLRDALSMESQVMQYFTLLN